MPKQARAHPPDRPVKLLLQVVAGDQQAWHRFVELYAGFIYSLAWRYARNDVDIASELFLVVLEGLRRPDAAGRMFYRLRRYLQSMERYGGLSRFVTWLALVARNLFRDWFREQGSRRVMPKEVEGLDRVDQELFRLVFWDGCTEREALEHLRSSFRPGLSEEEFEKHLQHVYTRLSDRNFWTIYQELLRRVPARGLGTSDPWSESRPLDLADPRAESRPDLACELLEEQTLASEVGWALRRAVLSLPFNTRNVVLLLWVHGVTGEECARILGFKNRQRVYDEMARARRLIRSYLRRLGIEKDKIHRAARFLDGWLENMEENN
jgi:RNA polymerase sigma factor (sigma-70 family)